MLFRSQKLSGIKGAGKALWEAGFKGQSGIFRMLQNTAYGNLRPMGSNIDLGGGFKPTDDRGRVLSSQQNKPQPVKPPNSTTSAQKQTVVNVQGSNSSNKKSSNRTNQRPQVTSRHPDSSNVFEKVMGIFR